MPANQSGSNLAAVQHENFVSGEWVPASGHGRFVIRNPARPQEMLGEFADSTECDALDAIESAATAAKDWAAMPAPQRGAILFRFAHLLDESATELARIVTL